MWHGNLPPDKYAPCTNRRSGNQMMMIKVRHTDCQHYACGKKRTIRRHGRNLLQKNGVLKSEIELLCPRWPLPAAVIAGYSQFLRRSILDTRDLDKLNNFVNTYLDYRKKISPKYTLVTQEVFPNFFPCMYYSNFDKDQTFIFNCRIFYLT